LNDPVRDEYLKPLIVVPEVAERFLYYKTDFE